MSVPIRALCVLTVCSAVAGAAPGHAAARDPFDVTVTQVVSPFLDRWDDPYVRTRRGGYVAIRKVRIRNRGPAPAPNTKVGFRWKQDGAIVKTLSVPRMNRGNERWTGSGRVPFPARNGRYHLWICADTPPAGPPEYRGGNCSKQRRLVIVRRTRPAPNPDGTVQLDIAPTSWDFGSVSPGTSAEAQNFTVRNLGTGDTGPGTVVITGAGSSAYEIGSNGCNPGLSGTSACRVRITFTPPAPGSYPAELVVTFPKGELRAALSGSGG